MTDKQTMVDYLTGKAKDLSAVQPALNRIMAAALAKMLDRVESGDPIAIEMVIVLCDKMEQNAAKIRQHQDGLPPASVN